VSTTSYWLEEAAEPFARPTRLGPVDVIVIGAGVTGCSCALTLAESGVRVRVHEAGQVAGGASGRNGGFALRGGVGGYDDARAALGPERARLLWELSERTLDRLDSLAPAPQDQAAATLAPRLKKENGWLRLAEPASALINRVRGCNPWPGAALMTPAGRLLLWRATAMRHPAEAPPGTLVATPSAGIGIVTGDGLLVPTEVQPESRRAMGWQEFLRGARLGPGARVTEISR